MRALVVLALVLGAGPALACLDDGDCGSGETCHGEKACAAGTCVPSSRCHCSGRRREDGRRVVLPHSARRVGPPGCRVRTGAVDRHRWLNPDAPARADVRLVVFREGTLQRIVGRRFDLPLADVPGAAAVRVSWGTRRICTVFDAARADVSADGPGGFHARDAAPPGVADCSRTSLLGS